MNFSLVDDPDEVEGDVALLWDVDPTLVWIAWVSREIYAEAFRLATGQPLGELADMAGRTERAIIVDTLVLNGIADPESRIDAFLAVLSNAATRLKDRMREAGERLPGAREAIAPLGVSLNKLADASQRVCDEGY